MSAPAALRLVPRPDVELNQLHRELDDLHEMIYRRGGISPSNAAIEELAKLVLLEIKLRDARDFEVPDVGPLSRILDPSRINQPGGLEDVKLAFRCVAALPEYSARLPGGGTQAIWPDDEPLRIARPEVLSEAVSSVRRWLSGAAECGHFDLIGTAFDVFLRGRYDHAGGLGTHMTPHTVAANLAKLCLTDLDLLSGSAEGPVFGDPCCGTGRFLVALVTELREHSAEPRLQEFLHGGVFGVDQSASAVAKARTNLLLLGISRPNVFRVEDSITDRSLDALHGKLRLVLTNPPFGDGKYDSTTGIELASRRLSALRGRSRIDPALAFVVRCLDLLGEGGRLGIVLPDGLVDGPILREALVDSGSHVRWRDVGVEANISLPTATFAMAGTVAKTSALVLRKSSRDPARVFLGRVEHIGFLKRGSVSVADPAGDDLPAVVEAGISALRANGGDQIEYLRRSPLAALVPIRDLRTLDPARVDPAVVESRASLLGENGIPMRNLLRLAERRTAAAGSASAFISVLHVDDLGRVAWHEALAHHPTTPGVIAYPGDVLVSLLNPQKLRATVVPDEFGTVLCSSEFGVFEACAVDPHAVLVLLHHPLVHAQLRPLGRGTSSSRRRIRPDDVLDMLVPRLPGATLEASATALRDALDGSRIAALAAAEVYGSLDARSGADSVDAIRRSG